MKSHLAFGICAALVIAFLYYVDTCGGHDPDIQSRHHLRMLLSDANRILFFDEGKAFADCVSLGEAYVDVTSCFESMLQRDRDDLSSRPRSDWQLSDKRKVLCQDGWGNPAKVWMKSNRAANEFVLRIEAASLKPNGGVIAVERSYPLQYLVDENER